MASKVRSTVQEEERAKLAEFTLFPTEDPFVIQTSKPSPASIDPTRPAIRRSYPSDDEFNPQVQQDGDGKITPIPTSPRKPIPSSWNQTKTQTHHTRASQSSGSDEITPLSPLGNLSTHQTPLARHPSSTSRTSQATFSTPGRDEMERKKAHVKGGDEGPFGSATGMQELVTRRRQVSERRSVSQRVEEVDKKGKKKDGEGGGLCKCCVM